MMEDRYHATTQNRFYPDMSNVNKNITVEVKLISPPTYFITQTLSVIMKYVQVVQLKSGLYLVFIKKCPFVHLISAKICGEIL